MFIPQRQFILICGNQGFGKSVWAKSFCTSLERLLVSDPLGSYPNVDFLTPPDQYIPAIVSQEKTSFRVGTYWDDELPLFCHSAMAATQCTLVIEECALMFKRAADLPDWFKPLVFMGRHARVNLLLVAQRANTIPIALRSQANRIITFRQTEPDDIDAICERMGGYQGDQIDNAEIIAQLEPLECLDWQDGAVSRYKVKPA